MSNVIQFPLPRFDESELDLYTAVEFAIRDIHDISLFLAGPTRVQLDECRQMLERALKADNARNT